MVRLLSAFLWVIKTIPIEVPPFRINISCQTLFSKSLLIDDTCSIWPKIRLLVLHIVVNRNLFGNWADKEPFNVKFLIYKRKI